MGKEIAQWSTNSWLTSAEIFLAIAAGLMASYVAAASINLIGKDDSTHVHQAHSASQVFIVSQGPQPHHSALSPVL